MPQVLSAHLLQELRTSNVRRISGGLSVRNPLRLHTLDVIVSVHHLDKLLQVTLSLCEEAFCASVGRQMELPPYEREREAEEHNTKNQ